MRYRELEKIAELFGIRDEDIPRFINAIEALVAGPVEDWHGKVKSGLA